MPTYTFYDPMTEHTFEKWMSVSEMEKFLKKNKGIELYFNTAPAVTFEGRSFREVDSRVPKGFKEVLSKIGENHPHSPLADQHYREADHKRIKARNIVKKAAKEANKAAAKRKK